MGRHRPEEWAGGFARRLMDPDTFFGGWGLKTMSEEDGVYNPIECPNGTVWPHDNSLRAHGPYRYGYGIETDRMASAILEPVSYFGYRGSSPATTRQAQTYP